MLHNNLDEFFSVFMNFSIDLHKRDGAQTQHRSNSTSQVRNQHENRLLLLLVRPCWHYQWVLNGSREIFLWNDFSRININFHHFKTEVGVRERRDKFFVRVECGAILANKIYVYVRKTRYLQHTTTTHENWEHYSWWVFVFDFRQS